VSYLTKEKSLAQSEPYELHLFWQGDYTFPYYPVLRTTTAQADPGLTHTTPISDVDDLQDMENDLSGNYYLTNNIDASATASWNGGDGFDPVGIFTGTLDGCGYTITGLTINRTSFLGLFSYLRSGAKVANLTLANINHTGTAYVGGLAGDVAVSDSNDILIQNVSVTGSIYMHASLSAGQRIGGLAGRVYDSGGSGGAKVYIYDSSANVTIDQTNSDGEDYRGGFVGQASTSVVIKNCYSTGNLINAPDSENASDVGGFAGRFDTGVTCSYCYATGNIGCGDNFVSCGGFVGSIPAAGSSIYRCYATGNVTGGADHYVGGFFGAGTGVDIDDCYATGDVVGDGLTNDYVGGFGGRNQAGNIQNCYSAGALSGNDKGGFLGDCDVTAVVTSCYWDTDTSGIMTTAQDKGEGKTTKQMFDKATYIGWDFDTIWLMSNLVENDDAWAYADAPEDVEYGGLIFRACYISGEKIEEGSTRIKSRTKVRTNWSNPYVWQYTIQPPSSKVHYRRYRGQGGDIKLIYVGEVLQVEFKQTNRQGNRYAEITIEPPRADLKEFGLVSRYSRQCTVELYSSLCGANPALYATTGTLDSYTNNVLTSTTFGTQADSYWNGGQIIIGDYRAKIVDHSGNDITILPYLYDINAGDSFTIYPGCDHLSGTCNTKFSNLANFKGQPNIPIMSPFGDGSIYK
jgi:hypothetical protein